ncbi:MAG: ABC transporter ATP-binding protein [Granulosicoccaceae bacterium]
MNTAEDSLLLAGDIHVDIAHHQLLSEIYIALHKNELIGLIGPNGAGKSTLLNVMAGLRAPNRGNVELLNRPLEKYPANQRAQLISWLAQQGHVHWPITVRNLVSLGRLPHQKAWKKTNDTAEQKVAAAMTETDCSHLAGRQFSTLSGGEQARVLIARALAADPTVLLADEPIASLDPGHQLQTMELLKRFATKGKGCITVMHDLSLATRYCDTLYLLDGGKLVAKGSPSAVLTDENLQKVYGVKALRGDTPSPWLVPYALCD